MGEYLVKEKILLILLILALFLPTTNSFAGAGDFNMSYLYFGSTNSYVEQVNQTNGALNVVSPSYFDLDEKGNLIFTSKYKSDFISSMHKKGIKVVPLLSNHWSRTIGQAALNNRQSLSTQIANAVKKYNLDGVNVDLEGLTKQEKEATTDFIKLLRSKIPANKEVSIAVAANPEGWTKGWHGSYDYKKLAKYADYLMIMAYDEHWDGSVSGPVASYSFAERSIKYALNQGVPSNKIVLGIPFFGRIWGTESKTSSLKGEGISANRVMPIIERYAGKIVYDEKFKSPKGVFTVKSGDPKTIVLGKELTEGKYEIWFENHQSLKEKLSLVRKYNIKGSGSWSLNQEDTTIWKDYKQWVKGSRFSDTVNHWAEKDIEAIAEKGWVMGTTNNTFSPNQNLTRAQAVTILVRALNLDNGQTISNTGFKDVSDNYWAKRSIDIANEKGIVKGISNDKFNPQEYITRSQMAAILNRIFQFQLSEEQKANSPFKDISVNYWASSHIIALSSNHIYGGYADGTFRPNSLTTRAQMASLMNRLSSDIENYNK